MGNTNPLGFTNEPGLLEEQYRAPRQAENLAPSQVPRLLAVIRNLGFPAPNVSIGSGRGAVALQLFDYLQRGANPDIGVEVVLHWPEFSADGHSAAYVVEAFKAGIWSGFGVVCAILHPDIPVSGLREQAIRQMPDLAQAFDRELAQIAMRDLD